MNGGAVPRWVWLAMLWLVWGTSWPAMRAVFQEMPIWQFRAISCLVGGAALLLIAAGSGAVIRVPRRLWGALTLAALFNMTVWHVATGYGLSLIGAGHAAVVCYTMPVWTALLSAAFLGERLTARNVVALALGMGGVAVLLSIDFSALGAHPLGFVFVLGAAVSWAIGTILIKRRVWPVSFTALAAWQLLIGLVPMAAIAVLTERFALHEASVRAWAGAVYVTVFGIVIGYALWFRVVALYSASVGAIGTLVIPAIGVASAALLLGEPVGWREILALALVVSAVAFVIFAPPSVRPAALSGTGPPAGS